MNSELLLETLNEKIPQTDIYSPRPSNLSRIGRVIWRAIEMYGYCDKQAILKEYCSLSGIDDFDLIREALGHNDYLIHNDLSFQNHLNLFIAYLLNAAPDVLEEIEFGEHSVA